MFFKRFCSVTSKRQALVIVIYAKKKFDFFSKILSFLVAVAINPPTPITPFEASLPSIYRILELIVLLN